MNHGLLFGQNCASYLLIHLISKLEIILGKYYSLIVPPGVWVAYLGHGSECTVCSLRLVIAFTSMVPIVYFVGRVVFSSRWYSVHVTEPVERVESERSCNVPLTEGLA